MRSRMPWRICSRTRGGSAPHSASPARNASGSSGSSMAGPSPCCSPELAPCRSLPLRSCRLLRALARRCSSPSFDCWPEALCWPGLGLPELELDDELDDELDCCCCCWRRDASSMIASRRARISSCVRVTSAAAADRSSNSVERRMPSIARSKVSASFCSPRSRSSRARASSCAACDPSPSPSMPRSSSRVFARGGSVTCGGASCAAAVAASSITQRPSRMMVIMPCFTLEVGRWFMVWPQVPGRWDRLV